MTQQFKFGDHDSMAVPVMRWIGERIKLFSKQETEK